jgi:hypothetical protein
MRLSSGHPGQQRPEDADGEHGDLSNTSMPRPGFPALHPLGRTTAPGAVTWRALPTTVKGPIGATAANALDGGVGNLPLAVGTRGMSRAMRGGV